MEFDHAVTGMLSEPVFQEPAAARGVQRALDVSLSLS